MIELLIWLLVVGLILYIVSLLRIDPTIKQIIYAVVVVFVVIYLLRYFVGGF